MCFKNNMNLGTYREVHIYTIYLAIKLQITQRIEFLSILVVQL